MAIGYILGVLSVAFSSLYHLLLKFGLNNINAFQAAFLETICTLIFCFIYQRIRTKSFRFQFNSTILLCGIINALGLIAFCVGLKLLSPVTVGLLGRTSIMFSILLSFIILKEVTSVPEVILILLGFIGCYMFIYRDAKYDSSVGILVTLAYAFFFAVTNIITKMKLSTVPSNDLLLSSRLVTFIMLSFYAVFADSDHFFSIAPKNLGFVALASFLGIFVGFNLYYAGLKYCRLSVFTMIRSTGPLFVAAYSWPFFPVTMTLAKWIGAAALFFSVLALVMVDVKKKER